MHKADRITAAVLLAFSLAFAAGGLKYYPYWSESGPGSGFLPAWLGGVMAALALLMLLRRPRAADAAEWLPRGESARRVVMLIAASVLYVALLKPLGMIVASALYLAFVMRYFERHAWRLTAVVVLAAAAANWLVFVHWLKVPFPLSPLGF
ncbi:MAG: tripartite tricarboxylate transporter TctB family protein [Betaproteobacteria bacterium]|nr:MAG: tripartite tricarboxylate transporter TctB family protein [Betaproteobacteria bacterium]